MPDTDYAWLRTSPSAVPRMMPPPTIKTLLSGPPIWHQLFVEWLSGDTNGMSNAKRVDPNADVAEVVRRFASMRTSRNTGQALAANLPSVRFAQFDATYPGFCEEVRSMRKQTDDLANAVRARAKSAGEPVPSRTEAAKQAGKIAQRSCMLNAISGQGAMLDANAAMIISMQIEKYKATALQNFNDALNDIADTPWDEDEVNEKGKKDEEGYHSKGFKIDAVNVMQKAGGAMLNAAARTKYAADAIGRTAPGQPVGDAAMNELLDSFVGFTDAVNFQGQAMSRAAHLIEEWAQEAVKHTLSKNFDTVYPRLGFALLSIRTTVRVSNAVLAFFPPFNAIGAGLMVSDAAADAAIRWLMVWKDKQNKGIQQQYIGMKFEFDENSGKAATALHALVEANEKLEKFLKKYTTGLVADLVAKGGKEATKLVGKAFGAEEHHKSEVGGKVSGALTLVGDQDNWQRLVDAGEALDLNADHVVSVEGAQHKVLEEAGKAGMRVLGITKDSLLEQAGAIAGGVLTLKAVVIDIANYADAQNKVLVRQAGLSEEDVVHLREFIKGGTAQDPNFSVLSSGELEILPRMPGANGPIAVRVGGVLMAIDLVDKRVVNRDEKLVSKTILSFAKENADPVVMHDYRYTIDWSSWQLVPGDRSPFTANVAAVTTVVGKEYRINVPLTCDLQRQLVTPALAGITPIGEPAPKFQLTDTAVINKLMAVGPIRYGRFAFAVTEEIGSLIDNHDGSVTFTTKSKLPKHPQTYNLTLEYSAQDGLTLVAMDPDPEVQEATRTRTKDELEALLTATGGQLVHTGLPIDIEPTVLGSTGNGQTTEFQVKGTIPGHFGPYRLRVSLDHRAGTLTVVDVDPDPATTQVQVMTDRLLNELGNTELRYGLAKLTITDEIRDLIAEPATGMLSMRVTATVREHQNPYQVDLIRTDADGFLITAIEPDPDEVERQRRTARLMSTHGPRVRLDAARGQFTNQ